MKGNTMAIAATPELVDLDHIAQMTGTRREYVRDHMVKRPDFPRPALVLSQKTRRWGRPDVERWLEKQMQRNAR